MKFVFILSAIAILSCAGCKSADSGKVESASFPTIERWWK